MRGTPDGDRTEDRDSPQAAYVHVPFCRHRCGYCNFTLVAGRDDWIDRYLDCLADELARLNDPRPVTTLFLGGGTPTHLSPAQLQRLLRLVSDWFPLKPAGEFSVEANPGDLLDDRRHQVLQAAGVNRLSLGVQSFSPRKLRLLERDHSPQDVRRVVDGCRRWVASLSIDLIFGIPAETRAEWDSDLASALELSIDHVSTYGLTIEKGTSFWNRRLHGQLFEVDDDLAADFYESAVDRLTASGFEHYEVSNFARPDRRCQHNLVYWSGRPFFGVGPGAASYTGVTRRVNHRSTARYLSLISSGQSPVAEEETLDDKDRARERLVFGLRRMDGWQLQEFAAETGFSLDELAGEVIARYIAAGFLQRDADCLRLTRRGLLISDSLWPDLLASH